MNSDNPGSPPEVNEELAAISAPRRGIRLRRPQRGEQVSGGIIFLMVLAVLIVGGGIVTLVYVLANPPVPSPPEEVPPLKVSLGRVEWMALPLKRSVAPLKTPPEKLWNGDLFPGAKRAETGELFSKVKGVGTSEGGRALRVVLEISNESGGTAVYESYNGAQRATLQDAAGRNVGNDDLAKFESVSQCGLRERLAPGGKVQDTLVFSPQDRKSPYFDLILPGLNLAQKNRAVLRVNPVEDPSPSPPPTSPTSPPQPTQPPPSLPPHSPPQALRVPNAPALAAAVKLVTEVYRVDLDKATTPALKVAVARKMLDDLKNEPDVSGKYALFTKARDLAVMSGDFITAVDAIDGCDAAFEIDGLAMIDEAALSTIRSALTANQRIELATKIMPRVDAAVTADRYNIARSLIVSGLSAARLANDASLTKAFTAKEQRVRESEAAFGDATNASRLLIGKPTDSQANLTLGKYYCFFKNDWKRGLPMLAFGNDPLLKGLAEKELAGVSEVDEQVRLGDGWWDAGANLFDTEKNSLKMHAAEWYRVALPFTQGLQKSKLEQRLGTLRG